MAEMRQLVSLLEDPERGGLGGHALPPHLQETVWRPTHKLYTRRRQHHQVDTSQTTTSVPRALYFLFIYKNIAAWTTWTNFLIFMNKKVVVFQSLMQTKRRIQLRIKMNFIRSAIPYYPLNALWKYLPCYSVISYRLYCNPDPDILYCNPDPDILYCSPDPDILYCNPDPDILYCNPDPDILYCSPDPNSLDDEREELDGFVGWMGLGGSIFQWHPAKQVKCGNASTPNIVSQVLQLLIHKYRYTVLQIL